MAVGTVSIGLFDKHVSPATTSYTDKISSHEAVQMWYVWDAVHYGNLARDYSTSLKPLLAESHRDGKTGYYLLRWLPLYPILVKILTITTSLNIPYSQLLISNAACLLALYLFYRLIRIDENDEFGRTVVAILILLPTSFIFSAALSESLFLALAIGSLYCARKQRWIGAGILAGLVALTRSEGFLMALPVLIEAFQQYGIGREKIRNYIKPIIAASLAVSGLLLFMLYCWMRTKNALAYVDSQFVEAGVKLGDPLVYVFHTLWSLKTMIPLGELIIIILTWKKLRWSYLAYAGIFLLIPLSIGNPPAGVGSLLRYIAVIFPVAIALGYLTRIKSLNGIIWTSLGIINGSLFILWVNWWTKYIL